MKGRNYKFLLDGLALQS